MSPLRAALWSLAPAVLVGAAAPLSTTVARTVDRAGLVTAGLLLGAAGLVAMLAVGADSSLRRSWSRRRCSRSGSWS